MTKNKSDMEFWDWLIRPLSRPISKFFLQYTKISPNTVTFFSFLMSILAAIFIYIGGRRNLFLAAFFILFFMLFDQADGDIARAKGLTSKLGHWLDGMVGFIGTELLIFAIAFGINTKLSLALGMLVAIIYPMQLMVVFFYKAEVVRDNAPINLGSSSIISKISKLYGLAFFKYMAILGCLFGQLLWVLMFFAIFGNLFWLGTIFIQYLNLKKN